MGTEQVPRPKLAEALFTPVQQRVLALLFGQPGRNFRSAEVIALADSGTGAVHRQLVRLAESGLVTVTWVGNQKHYQANRDSPVFSELHGLVVNPGLRPGLCPDRTVPVSLWTVDPLS